MHERPSDMGKYGIFDVLVKDMLLRSVVHSMTFVHGMLGLTRLTVNSLICPYLGHLYTARIDYDVYP